MSAPMLVAYSMAAMASAVVPNPSEAMNFNGTRLTFQATPVTPRSLSPTAPMVPETALEIAADSSTGFALLHFPVPHHPDIYDPDRGELSIEDERSYFDNLALTDRTLGDLRAAMEAEHLWDTSIVVVTSDHWWRAIHRGDWGLLPEEEAVFAGGLDRRIPFLVKFAGQQEPLFYSKPFNTILFHDLVLEVFAERLSTPNEFQAWLDANRASAPIPYLWAKRARPAPRRPLRR